jgi:hypothetical protein
MRMAIKTKLEHQLLIITTLRPITTPMYMLLLLSLYEAVLFELAELEVRLLDTIVSPEVPELADLARSL